ncbi:hypothetical protein AMAG_15891 [Allomyces macrogynus ATCC 38327]|uniref:Uncharacterized protein n=1 Tax=Allomyces macrogynus (strain ATCC 38327) TaxID=578462 RepID=A0A0L0T942_ALLM3|nr:hypothetical protein AMAG_15891 [Allomyces macrogynus ATCC 38327]|eukprot:KNE71236.1 hypothetical protein AMAG_15891 [Allomyces macrogynus ATCC 38327]
MYFGAACPSAPHKPFGDSPWVEALVGVALAFASCALVIGCFVVKGKLGREPDVTMREWARRAWAAAAKWVRMRMSKEGQVELTLAARGDKYMRAHPQKEMEWTPALVAALADASPGRLEPALLYGLPTKSHAVSYGAGDVAGILIEGGKVYYSRNGKVVSEVEMAAEPGMHVAIGATGPCSVKVHWHGPWRWAEANEKEYQYVHEEDGPRLYVGEQEPASLALHKNGDMNDFPPPYSWETGSSSSRRP